MKPRHLHIEPLESRRMLAVILDSISNLTVAEGSPVRVDADFVDSTPGGSYAASITWQPGDSPQGGTFSSQPSGSNGNLRVRYDYSYDDSGFFTAARREVLEVGAELVVGRFNDAFSGFAPSGSNRFNATFLNPTTGVATSIPNFSVAANEIVIFIGSRDLPGDSLANAGSGGGNGTLPFFDFAISRGQAGVPESDFAPWGGAISFDNLKTWHDGLSTEGFSNNENDMLSVVVHELGHILGFTSGVESFSRWVNNGRFTGINATQAYDGTGSPPLDSDNSHWQANLRDNGAEVSFDPDVTTGRRKLVTELDFAALADVGWELRSRTTNGQVTDTNVYADNGTFTASITVQNGSDTATRPFQVTVTNVAPTIPALETITVQANTPLQFSTDFNDPGAGDTHVAAIAWGDGTGQQELLVNQSARSASGQHVYTQPGTYQATVGVQDDDGAQTNRQFTVIVTDPPRGDWQNAANQFDVNVNGAIDPLDALLIINELNDRLVSNPSTGLLPPAPNNLTNFLDVTGDDVVAPQDAILVINALSSSNNLRTGNDARSTTTVSAAQEPVAPLSSGQLTSFSTEPAGEDESARTDEVFADFSMSWLRS